MDIGNFTKKIEAIKNKLPPKLTLPDIPIIDLIDISEIYHIKNETHIRIEIEIPILNKEKSIFMELIPLPFIENEQIKIYNMNTKYIFEQNGELKTIHKKDLKNCIRINELTICNSLLMEKMELADECIESMFWNKFDGCEEVNLQQQNYFLDTSPSSIYCFIKKPITLRVSCLNKDEIFNLTESREIQLGEHCELYKITHKINESSLNSIEINYEYFKPNLYEYDPNNEKPKNGITLIDRFNMEFAELENEIRDIQNEIDEEIEKEIEQSNKTSWIVNISEGITNVFNKLFSFSLTLILFWIFVPIIIFIIITMLCNKIIRSIAK